MRGNENVSDSKRYFDWLFYANLDYLAAKNLVADERCYPVVAFHCQQCIEKALKGYLLFKRHKLFDGHNLAWLCKQAAQNDSHFSQWVVGCASLGRYYIETRYPADVPVDIDTPTIDLIFGWASDMLDFIQETIRFDFMSYRKKR